MKGYLDCWTSNAAVLFSQALSGEPRLEEATEGLPGSISGLGWVAQVSGDLEGRFAIELDRSVLETPLLGEGVDQESAWEELLREVSEAAAGELRAATGTACRIDSLRREELDGRSTRSFRLTSNGNSWSVMVRDDLRNRPEVQRDADPSKGVVGKEQRQTGESSAAIDLLLDVELDAALRFGCCEMPLGEILELGPGDVVELDRHISDPVDLIVGDKIVARGDVVLVNGNFGLRVTEVAEPQRRLESIRCLF